VTAGNTIILKVNGYTFCCKLTHATQTS